MFACSLQGFPEDQVHQMCSDSVYLNYFSKYIHHSVQNGINYAFWGNFNICYDFRLFNSKMGSIYYFQFSGGKLPESVVSVCLLLWTMLWNCIKCVIQESNDSTLKLVLQCWLLHMFTDSVKPVWFRSNKTTLWLNIHAIWSSLLTLSVHLVQEPYPVAKKALRHYSITNQVIFILGVGRWRVYLWHQGQW